MIFLRRAYAVFLVVLICAACVCVPCSASYAAGIEADSGDFVLANDVEGLYSGIPFTNDLFYSMSLCYQISHNVSYPGQANFALAISRGPTAVERGGRIGFAFVMNSEDYQNGVSDPRYVSYIFTDVFNIDVYSAFRSPQASQSSGVVELTGISSRVSENIPCWFSTIPYRNSISVRRSVLENSNSSCYSSLFNTLEEAADAFLSYNPNPSNYSLTFAIPAGNAVVIKSSNFTFRATTTQVIAGTASEGMPYTNQTWGYSSSLPTTINQSTLDYGAYWTPTGPFDSSGYTKTAIFEESKGSIGVDSQPYFIFCNPMYCFSRGREDPNFMTLNNTVYVQLTGNIQDIWNAPLRTYLTQAAGSPASSTGTSDDNSSWQHASYDTTPNSTVTWRDPDGEVVTPSAGGLTVTNPETSFFESISSAFERFTSIFTWGHEAINSIISGGRDFFTAFTQIFSFLPSEVMTVLSAALILIIVIGVVKVLL